MNSSEQEGQELYARPGKYTIWIALRDHQGRVAAQAAERLVGD
jgi:hypothetical protein